MNYNKLNNINPMKILSHRDPLGMILSKKILSHNQMLQLYNINEHIKAQILIAVMITGRMNCIK